MTVDKKSDNRKLLVDVSEQVVVKIAKNKKTQEKCEDADNKCDKETDGE